MPKTVWSLAPYHHVKGEWLRTDGTVVPTPPVESTPSQQRWRVAGTEASVRRDDLASEVHKAMSAQAALDDTELWMEIDDDDVLQQHAYKALDYWPESDIFDAPTLNLEKRTSVPVVHEFVSVDYPQLIALLWCTLHVNSDGYVSVKTKLTYRSTNPDLGWAHDPSVVINGDSNATDWKDCTSSVVACDVPLGGEYFGIDVRQGIARLLELSRQIGQLTEVRIPDLRPHFNAGDTALTYLPGRNNFTTQFYRNMVDIVQGVPAMERLNEHLNGIVRELRMLGVVANRKGNFNLVKLLTGKLSELTVVIDPTESNEKAVLRGQLGKDTDHRVTLDLAQGVAVVSCRKDSREDTAAAWDIAKFKAELSGESDVLMEFARAFNEPAEQARIKKIMQERKVSHPR